VKAAAVVGAGDVVSAAPADEKPDEPKKPVAKAAPAFTLTGADLSIETDVAILRSSSSSLLGSVAVAAGGYGAGLLALAAGLLVRRRRSIDPVKAGLQRQMRTLRACVASERSAKDVADALRKMAALRGDVRTSAEGLDDLLASLDETAYAPGGAAATIAGDLRARAVAVADSIVEEVR
jgi:hypothetical protein